MKKFNINFSHLKEDSNIRMDEKFYRFYNKNNWNIFNSKNQERIKLKDILESDEKIFKYQEGEEYYGIPTGSSYIDEYGDIIDKQIVTKEEHPNRLKYKINKDSILISSLRLARAPALNYSEIDYDKYVFSNGFYIFKIKNGWKKEFVLGLLNSPEIKNAIDNHIYRGIGISSYKAEDLLKIEVPNISIEKQELFMEETKKLEKEIQIRKDKIKEKGEIINNLFSKYFHYDKDIIYKVHKGMTYGTQKEGNTALSIMNGKFSEITDNKCRLSTRANNSIIKEIYKILNKVGTIQTKDIVTEPIHRGKSPEYDEEGEIPVIKTAHITSNGINHEYVEFVNESFYAKKTDAQLKKGDVLLTSTGKPSIGKIDIFETDDKAIPDGHVSIIRIDNTIYHPKFFVYFIRSVLGYVQLEKEYVGCTNQIELYPDSINGILLPDISLDLQEKIVEEIEAEIQEQDLIKAQINIIKGQINEILENIIKE